MIGDKKPTITIKSVMSELRETKQVIYF